MGKAGKIGFGIFIIMGIIFFSQCSPHASKSLLNFFFDGVPQSDTIPGMAELSETEMDSVEIPGLDVEEKSRPLLVHYPYQERECAACHDELSLGNMVEPEPGLCYLCHEDLSGKYAYLHGPVAGGYCTSCHDPHSSEYEKLLRIKGDDLCFFCHLEDAVRKNEIHQDTGGMLCTDCHNPHGGEDKYIFQ